VDQLTSTSRPGPRRSRSAIRPAGARPIHTALTGDVLRFHPRCDCERTSSRFPPGTIANKARPGLSLSPSHRTRLSVETGEEPGALSPPAPKSIFNQPRQPPIANQPVRRAWSQQRKAASAPQILLDLGLKDIRVPHQSPEKVVALASYGIRIAEQGFPLRHRKHASLAIRFFCLSTYAIFTDCRIAFLRRRGLRRWCGLGMQAGFFPGRFKYLRFFSKALARRSRESPASQPTLLNGNHIPLRICKILPGPSPGPIPGNLLATVSEFAVIEIDRHPPLHAAFFLWPKVNLWETEKQHSMERRKFRRRVSRMGQSPQHKQSGKYSKWQ